MSLAVHSALLFPKPLPAAIRLAAIEHQRVWIVEQGKSGLF